MNSKLEYIKENLGIINKMIEGKRPKFEIARVLGVKYATLDKYLKEFGIDYKGNPSRKGFLHYSERKNINLYLNGNINIQASKLRTRLIEEGLKDEKCEGCGNTEWMGKKIPLELHHKNFNHYDNRLENLQILCCNCHSLVHEYCNTKGKTESKVDYAALEKSLDEKQFEIAKKVKVIKPKKEKVKRFCKTCGKELTSHQKNYCSYECSYRASRKIPSIEALTIKLHEFKFNKSKTGRYFGVSDKAVKKWINKYNIT
jgi:ribosomal protein L37E